MRQSRRLISYIIGAVACGTFVAGMVFWNMHSPVAKWYSPAKVEKKRQLALPDPPSNDYVGGDACRRCHDSIWNRYQSHPMAHSAAPALDASPIEDFDQQPTFTVSTPIGEKEYRVERTAAGQFHHESLKDPLLGLIYDQRVKIEYAVGSGRHGRSYLLTENGCVFMSPISWYSQKGRWDLSPAYQPEKNPRFERRILQTCLVCHTDQIAVNRDEPDRYSSKVILRPNISCERCHGPGGGHIAYQERFATSGASSEADPIVNPSKLDSDRRESVCWQCHFSAEERIPRYGRIDSDFRPGMNFDDIWVAFVQQVQVEPDGSMRAVSHVEQTRSSKCFQRSEGRFGCLSCHDPHFSPPEAQKELFYRDKCMACHNDRGCSLPVNERIRKSESDSCVVCHMPSRGLNAVPHTSQVDHRVLRRPEHEEVSASQSPLVLFRYGDRELPWVETERAWGIVLAKFALNEVDTKFAAIAAEKLNSVIDYVPDDSDVLEWLGVCEQLIGNRKAARAHWDRILNRSPNHERALRRIADISATSSDLTTVRDALVRFLNTNAWQSEHQSRLAGIYGSLGDLDAAKQAALESLHVNPSAPNPHGILAEIYQLQGDHANAFRQKTIFAKLATQKQSPSVP